MKRRIAFAGSLRCMIDVLDRLNVALAGRYSLQRELGRGGMATVYLAQDLRHDRPIAVKVLHPELAATLGPERFQREIRVAAQLQHPQILPVYDSGADAGVLWFTMPYVEGETLRQRLQRTGALPIPEACAHSGLHSSGPGIRPPARGRPPRCQAGERLAQPGERLPRRLRRCEAARCARPISIRRPRGWWSEPRPTWPPSRQKPIRQPTTGQISTPLASWPTSYSPASRPSPNLPLGLLLAAHAIREPEPIARRRPEVPAPLASLIARCLRKDPAERWDSADALCGVLQATALSEP